MRSRQQRTYANYDTQSTRPQQESTSPWRNVARRLTSGEIRDMPTRREFLTATGAALSVTALSRSLKAASSPPSRLPQISTNQYPWETFYRRDGKHFVDDLEASFAEVAAAGFTNLEPNFTSVQQVDQFCAAMKPLGVAMPSIYVNSVLHEATAAERSIEEVLRIATRARDLADTSIVVTNPSPLRWGGPENKTEAELLIQGKALQKLGAALSAENLTLAYHNHDSEFRLGAREFHHMLNATDPAHVKFCLDAHWVYRGSGDSNLAVFNTIALYGDRVVELHLRQSSGGVWSETFTPAGDIDYPRLMTALSARSLRPLLTLEQAVEKKSAHTQNALTAHRASLAGLLKLVS